MKKYTKEQLVFYLKKLSIELKKTPTIKEINKSNYPSASTYSSRFGSRNKALLESGLKINMKKKYEKKELLENLKQLAKELGKTPKPGNLKNKKWAASYSTYKKAFGSWRNAIREAKLNTISPANLKEFVRRKN